MPIYTLTTVTLLTELLLALREINVSRQRCRELIDSGVAAVDWVDLYDQK